MKKLTLIAVLLLVLGLSSGFALDLKPGLALSGSESVKFAVNLEANPLTTGFTNSASGDMVITLLPADSSDTHKGEGAIYGSITLSNLEWVWTDTGISAGGHEPDFAATLFIPPFQIDLGAPAMNADITNPIEDQGNNGVYGFGSGTTGYMMIDNIVDTEAAMASQYAGNGLDIRYTDPSGLFFVQGDVKSNGTEVTNTANAYAIGAEVGLTVAPIAVNVGVYQGFLYASNPLAAEASLTLTLAGIGSATVGADVAYDTVAATLTYDVGFGASMNFNKDGTAYLAAKGLLNSAQHLDAVAAMVIPAGTLMGPLAFTYALYALDVLAPANGYEFTTYAIIGYQIDLSDTMYVKPQITAGYGQPGSDEPTTTPILNASPSVEIGLAKAPLSTVTIGWQSNNLMATPVGAGSAYITLKITY